MAIIQDDNKVDNGNPGMVSIIGRKGKRYSSEGNPPLQPVMGERYWFDSSAALTAYGFTMQSPCLGIEPQRSVK
jgi:hypothetical protein